MADAADSKSAAEKHTGSIPVAGIGLPTNE